MMKLFTEVKIQESPVKIDYFKNLTFIGSCFAEDISQKFKDLKFNTLTNPFGILYNPLSIKSMLQKIESGYVYSESDLFYDKSQWHCFDFHSLFSNSDKKEALKAMNNAVTNAQTFLKKTDFIFITLGSAFVYFLKENSLSVSNCHRQNQNIFTRRLITVKEATEALHSIVITLLNFNANMHIVFTVSPLRHFADGAHENNVSKATLMLAIHEIQKNNPLTYFPSYEIVMDELRDYRFYDTDLIHLSDSAKTIVFEKMLNAYCSKKMMLDIDEIENFLKASKHRVKNINADVLLDFSSKYIAKANALEENIKGLDLTLEKEHFKALLKASCH